MKKITDRMKFTINHKFLVTLLLSLTCLLMPAESLRETKTPFELKEILNGTYRASSWNGTWIKDDAFLYGKKDGFYVYDLTNNSSDLFIGRTFLKGYDSASIELSADLQYILIKYNVTAVFRHSKTARYAIYDITNEEYFDLEKGEQLQNVEWCPVGHCLIYVYKNNIYYLSEPEEYQNPGVVTRNGIPGVIYNGAADWVYEEEVFASGNAFWFSPDGKYLAYANFNDTKVPEMEYFVYGDPGTLESQYPTVATIKYPKVGATNPEVNLYVANLHSPDSEHYRFAHPAELDEFILYGVIWITAQQFSVVATNRVQNHSITARCAIGGSCKREAEFKQENGWLNVVLPLYDQTGAFRLDVVGQPEGDDFYLHLTLTDLEGSKVRRLTNGRRRVENVLGWNRATNLIYYTSTTEGTPSEQQVYSVNTETGEDLCLTCDYITKTGPCKFATASFSNNLSYYAKICLGLGPNYVTISSTKDAKQEVLYEDNEKVRILLARRSSPILKDYIYTLPSGYLARIRMYLPPNFVSNGSKKYPAILKVYSGPDADLINDKYGVNEKDYFVTNREYIYVNVDARGSGKEGFNRMFQVYKKFGTVEMEDQIAVMKHLVNTFSYIDQDRVGVWGWSYGGFAAAMILSKDVDKVFAFALSVAPVTNFIYYDSIYTERYMGLLDENKEGYNGTDVTKKVEQFRNRNFFLIHGNADDNVHYQQSMMLSKALELADIQFRQQSYPDENHSLAHVDLHLYHTIDRYWSDIFSKVNSTTTKKA